MQATRLPQPIAAYVAAANAQDVDAVTGCFTVSAVVHDEKQDRHGIAAIRAWAEEVSEKYRPTVEMFGAAETDGETILLRGRVSGNFPGSPIELRYAFKLKGGKIERLEIR
jgi:hypothetical protein